MINNHINNFIFNLPIININNNFENLTNKFINLTNENKNELKELLAYLTLTLKPNYYNTIQQDPFCNLSTYNLPIIKFGIKKFLDKIVPSINNNDIDEIIEMCSVEQNSTFSNHYLNKNYSQKTYHFMKSINITNMDDEKIIEIHNQIQNKFETSFIKSKNYFYLIAICANYNLDELNFTHICLKNLNLQKINFSKSNLHNANLQNSNLREAVLYKTIFTQANLHNCNLQKANLNEANLFEAKLQKAKLQKATIIKATLSKANFENANLIDTKLNESILIETYLPRSKLQRASLINTTIMYSNLQDANLSKARLINANISGTNLTNANLKSTNLKNSNVYKTNFYKTNLTGANLTNSRNLTYSYNLKSATLNEALFINVDLKSIDLQNASMIKINLTNSLLKKTNLINADLSNAILINTDFAGANLSYAKLNLVSICRANFQNAILHNTTITLSLEKNNFSLNYLDFLFNHFSNKRSILTAIDSINNDYQTLKINLMVEIINWIDVPVNINRIDTNIRELFKDILYNNPIYCENQIINLFIIKNLLKTKLELAHTTAVIFKEIEIKILYNYIKGAYKNNYNSQLLFNFNSLFNQLIYWCFKSNKDEIHNIGSFIRNKYMQTDKLQPFLATKNAIEYINDLRNDNDQFFFATNDSYNNLHAVIVSKDYLNKFIYNNYLINDVNWDNLTHIINQEIQPVGNQNLRELFYLFRLFYNSYNFHKNQINFINLLSILNLGDYYQMFIDAIKQKSKKINLTPAIHQQNLQNIFKPYLIPENSMELYYTDALQISISNNHFNEIIIQFTLENKSLSEQAAVILCLCGVFAKFSSSYFFGIEYDSPLALRYYALALMNKALQIDNNIIPSEYLGRNDNNWQYKFLGIDNAFTCTAMLSEIILDYCKLYFPNIAKDIIPLAWQ